jgi:hypothetical protein
MVFLRGLFSFLIRRWILCDQIRFDGIIFFKEGIEIDHKIFDHLKYRKGSIRIFIFKIFDQLLARLTTDTINSHSIRSTDAVGTGHSKREGGILPPSDSVEAVKEPVHRVRFYLKGLVIRVFILCRIKTEDFQLNIHRYLFYPLTLPLSHRGERDLFEEYPMVLFLPLDGGG